MIDRYALFIGVENLAQTFGLKDTTGYAAVYNASPTKYLPIITKQNPTRLQYAYWGLIPEMAKSKSISPRLYNLDWEKANSSNLHRKNLVANRALIPACGYYFWKAQGKKQQIPYYTYHNKYPVMGIAGLWNYFDDDNGNSNVCFNMLTRSEPSTKNTWSETLPVIINPENFNLWLAPSQDLVSLPATFDHFDPNQWTTHAVSPEIKDASIEHPELIKRTKPADQYGNYTLFD